MSEIEKEFVLYIKFFLVVGDNLSCFRFYLLATSVFFILLSFLRSYVSNYIFRIWEGKVGEHEEDDEL